jgi:hypothetical protein
VRSFRTASDLFPPLPTEHIRIGDALKPHVEHAEPHGRTGSGPDLGRLPAVGRTRTGVPRPGLATLARARRSDFRVRLGSAGSAVPDPTPGGLRLHATVLGQPVYGNDAPRVKTPTSLAYFVNYRSIHDLES